MTDAPREGTDALDQVLAPSSIAVVGASRRKEAIGRQILENLIHGDVQVPVYPVNPNAESICGVRAFASIQDVPDPVDLAVIAVPADHVLDVAQACGEAGVGGLVVITAGFREVDGEGEAREARLREIVDRYGMRVVGPNCMGVLNTEPGTRMNATFSPAEVPEGGLAFVSQSGALGLAILDVAEELGLGLSHFVSLGNRLDVSSNDLIEAWGADDRVDAILLYLEHFGNPRNFLDVARAIGREKPIIAVKSGRSPAGAKAAASHTGSLAERAEVADALFEQCGVVHVHTIDEMFALARVFARAPAPSGRRVAILTNSGGPGVMATDALYEHGLEIADLSASTTARLRDAAASIASVANPVDLTAGAGPEAYGEALAALLEDPGVDAVLTIYTPPTFQDDAAVARALLEPERDGTPVLACVLGRGQQDTAYHTLSEAGIPTYTFPEAAVQSLAAYADYVQHRERGIGTVPTVDADRDQADALIATALAEDREWLAPEAAFSLLEAYGIPVATPRRSATPEATRGIAAELEGRVVVKGVADALVHKTEHDAVAVGLDTPEAAEAAHREMGKRLTEAGIELDGVIVQPQVEGVAEVLMGTTADPHYGALIAFGLGGIYAEVLDDVVFRLAPMTDADARRMVRSIRAWPLLTGARGQPPADVEAVQDTLLRLSALASEQPAIREMDLNPVIVRDDGRGLAAVDVRVRLWPDGEPVPAPGRAPSSG